MSFNPCFTGTSSHTLSGHDRQLSTAIVSILVLLEPPLIPKFIIVNTLPIFCFNPCFTGTSSHTMWQEKGTGR